MAHLAAIVHQIADIERQTAGVRCHVPAGVVEDATNLDGLHRLAVLLDLPGTVRNVTRDRKRQRIGIDQAVPIVQTAELELGRRRGNYALPVNQRSAQSRVDMFAGDGPASVIQLAAGNIQRLARYDLRCVDQRIGVNLEIAVAADHTASLAVCGRPACVSKFSVDVDGRIVT
ncbi:hypothetical protein PCO31111_01441 [Pandoraea communis]|uniref:Uncharacterized protein n=1 Tax=Pandoraea communis TaxID=2508297 RepID=A0A5E4TGT2_9BURK|nr:hypothetical protein PCO31111_01441 [Pandoraea communis]